MMIPRQCDRCSAPARLSLNLVLSPLGERPRRQQYSKALHLCQSCAGKLASESQHSGPSEADRLLRRLLTRANKNSAEGSEP